SVWDEEPAIVGGRDRRRAIVDVELGVDMQEVGLDRRLRDEQAGRGAAVRLSLGDQGQDLELALAQGVLRGRAQLADQSRGHRWREDGLVARRGPDRADELVAWRV